MNSSQNTTPALLPVGRCQIAATAFLARKSRKQHPAGSFDRARRWYPADSERRDCCAQIRSPSAAWPMSLMLHCRTLEHVAAVYEASPADVRWCIAEIADPGCHARKADARRAKAADARAQKRAVAAQVAPAPVVTRLDLARCPVCSVRIAGSSPAGVAPIAAHTCAACGCWAHSECSQHVAHSCPRYGCTGQMVPAVWIASSEEPIIVARAEAGVR